MKLYVIVIAYKRSIALRGLIDSFVMQINPHWILTMVHDGPAPEDVQDTMKLYDNDKRICWFDTEKQPGDYGHANRRAMLRMLEGDTDDFVLITNDDNYYVPGFVEYVFREVVNSRQKVGMVYCDFLHHRFEWDVVNALPKLNHIDMGAFVVRLSLAQEVGFIHNEPHADGLFAEECDAACKNKRLRVIHIPKVLFVHN